MKIYAIQIRRSGPQGEWVEHSHYDHSVDVMKEFSRIVKEVKSLDADAYQYTGYPGQTNRDPVEIRVLSAMRSGEDLVPVEILDYQIL